MRYLFKHQIRTGHILILLSVLIILAACSTPRPSTGLTPSLTIAPTDTLVPLRTPAPDDEDLSVLDIPGLNVVPTLISISPTRTPAPTATPDAISEGIDQFMQRVGLSSTIFLGLTTEDWINLGVSLIFVFGGYLIGTWLIRGVLPRWVKRSETLLDDRLFNAARDQLRWLIVVFTARLALSRLNFIDPQLKTLISDILFFIIFFLSVLMFWRLIDLVAEMVDQQAKKAGEYRVARSLITLMVWGLRLILIIIGTSIILNHFGVNVTWFSFIVALLALVIFLAGRDILADIIAGAMILIDRPFRIGDRLDLKSVDRYGDVFDIGMHSTKILTPDNRLMIIPNSEISKTSIINYSFPDSSLNDTITVMVSYENDPDEVVKIILEAIRSTDGVWLEREPSAIFREFHEYHVSYWASWWLENYKTRSVVKDRVGRAIFRALKDANVTFPVQQNSILQKQHDPEIGNPPPEDQF